ncbi:hemolysin family protein [Gudongella oleilytica]|jgi:putative hemolysin|uniref:hemolysin family protein n=1 Tax=Gudongella oleilytica TaxID=1582259 RepID=UPI000FF8A05C|nr:hemolysin family protein [Gudongella oleilytica]MDY0256382.1 hemolysin family protein [Gudongella oleilytica]HMM69607.1 hemolysin family protein [Gudongella oleilytica]
MGIEQDLNITGKLVLIFVLTLVNAFFAASEMAMVSVDRIRLINKAEEGDKKARLLLDILKEPSRFLSTIQVGITFAGFFSSASAAVSISTALGGRLEALGVPFGKDIAFVGITLMLSYIMLVIGELVPKRIALNHAERFAMLAVRPISMVAKVMHPFVTFLSLSTNAILRLLGVSQEGVEAKVTLEEISSMVEVGHEQGFINPVEREMIKSVISFDDKLAEEIMTARTEVYMIDADDRIEDYIDDLLSLKYSRIPVYEEDIDNIVGILYLKDYLLEAYKSGFLNVDIKAILRPAYFVPERKNINDLFLELKNTRKHMAVLIDEYGGFSGIVTMEDLIEEIMGDIDDEYDHDDPDVKLLDKDTYIARGSVSIKELNSRLEIELDEETEDYDTLGGFIIHHLGYIPDDGDKPELTISDLSFRVESVEDKRVVAVRISKSESHEKKEE